MVFAHAPIGALTTKLVFGESSKKWKSVAYLFGIIGSVFPDVDTLILLFNEDINHRTLLTHSLVPYFLIFFLCMLIFRKRQVFLLLSGAFFVGVVSHLVVDYFVGGVSLLSPFIHQIYGFKIQINATPNTFAEKYISSKYTLYELLGIVVFLISWFKEKNLVYRYIPLLFVTSAGFMLLLLDLF